MKKGLTVTMALWFPLVILVISLKMLAGTPAQAAPPVMPLQQAPGDCEVTTTADSGPGSLRQCMLDLQAGATITFSTSVFPPASPMTIVLTSALPELITDNVTIDASNAGVILDGSGTPDNTNGLEITSSGNIIKGLQILRFPENGIVIKDGAQNNTIGGSRAVGNGPTGEGNVLSGHGDDNGIEITGSGTMSNTIIGNLIGTDATGTQAVPNSGPGIFIWQGANHNRIEDNVISGNEGDGIGISGSDTDYNIIVGNYIGVDATGTAALPNGRDGINVSGGSSDNLIGGDTADERNVISGNDDNGVRIDSSGTMSNTVSGNYIGTDVSGTAALQNGNRGIFISGAPRNTIGGTTPGERNIINDGIHIFDTGADENIVIGNYIGLSADGVSALGGNWNGVGISEGTGNRVGGSTAGEGNVISGNDGGSGIYFWGSAHGNIVMGNYIGTDATGMLAVPNRCDGVGIADGSTFNVIGGANPGESNLISGNTDNGIGIYGMGTVDNMIIGNYIGTDANGTSDLGNGRSGVLISGATQRNTVGGMIEGERNIVSGNGLYGVLVWGDGTDQNTISGNYIGTDVNGSGALGNGYSGILIGGGASANTIGGPTVSDGNVVAYHNAFGIYLYGTSTLSNTISHNSIYSNTDKGIELGYGANSYMFPPLLTEVSDSTVKGIAVPNATVEVFSDDDDEGHWFHGSTTADASGNFTFTVAAPFTGTHVTATATDAGGNTSEFSSAYEPGRDVVAIAIYAPQLRQQIDVALTPLVRVGNGGTAAETFSVTAVITCAGARVYEDQQTVADLDALHYRTLSFIPWTPTVLGDYTFEVTVHPSPPDDDSSNDRLTLDFHVADDRYDLWSRDNPTDDGREPAVGPVWQSPDLWVRNAADGLSEHQDPINNITNTVYIRVRNRGTLTATDATVTVYWHPPALVIGQSWWEPIGTATAGEIAPGAVYTAAMDWQPQITGVLTEPYHTCLIDVISSTQDPAPLQWDVRGANNIEQRNVDIISPTTTSSLHAASSTAVSMTFSVGNPYAGEQLVDVIVDATGVPAGSEVRLDLGELFGRWQRFGQGSLTGATEVSGTTQVAIPGGGEATIGGLPLAGEELIEVVMEVGGLNGRRGEIDVSERIGGEVLGGISLHVVGRIEVFLPVVMRNL